MTAVTGAFLATAAPALADIAPAVTVKAATAVAYTTAHVSGTVNPNGGPSITSWHFERSPSSEESWTPVTGGEFTASQSKEKKPLEVKLVLEALQPNTAYQIRLVATNAGGETISTKPNPTFVTKEVTRPGVTIAAPSSISGTTVQLSGTINPNAPGKAPQDPAFNTKWTFECTPECPGLAGGEVPADNSAHTVTASMAELRPHTTYMVTLVASNLGGQETAGPETFTTLAVAPMIAEPFVTNVASTSATLHAAVNPGGADTTYRFEDAVGGGEYALVRGPAGESLQGAEGDAGTGIVPVSVDLHVSGIAPSTPYRFRLVASSPVEKLVLGPGVSFTTQAIGGDLVLPDNRKWELVSPPNKFGALIEPIKEYGVIQAATDGNAISYLANAPTEAQPQGDSNEVQVLSRRGPGGWSSQDVAIPHNSEIGKTVGPGQEYRFFSEDLSAAAVQPFGAFVPQLSVEASEQTAYLRSLSPLCAATCYRPFVTGKVGYANVPLGTVFGNEGECEAKNEMGAKSICGPEFLGATTDLTHTVLRSSVALKTGAEAEQLYEWAGGQLTPISVLPDGKLVSETSAPTLGDKNQSARGAISRDGTRVVWTEGSAALYVRDVAKAETVRLDAVQSGASGAGLASPRFQIASSDGSKIFFTDTQQLTSNSGASGTGTEHKADLYECKMLEEDGKLTCQLSDLTPLGAGNERADVQGSVLGTSEDGSWVYFVAQGRLASGAIPGSCATAEGVGVGVCNLYVWHGGTTELIAVLSGGDRHDWGTAFAKLSQVSARVAPNGEWLAFMSQRSLTGYDNRDVQTGRPVAEVYLYSSAAHGLVCASCNPTGARAAGVEYQKLEAGHGGIVGGTELWEGQALVAANVPTWTSMASGAQEKVRYQSRYLLNSGRLFFNSGDALVPQDVNGTEDVYQYEPSGVGSCTNASVTFNALASGCVSLISSGTSAQESGFLDASETGGDVFFLTADRLEPTQDRDAAFDVYDAHTCSAQSPCFATLPSQLLPCTTGDSCKAAATPQPEIFSAAASGTFSGPGNLLPAAKPPVKPLTNAQRLAKALKACRAKHNRKQRASCEREAKKRYASAHNATKARRGRRVRR